MAATIGSIVRIRLCSLILCFVERLLYFDPFLLAIVRVPTVMEKHGKNLVMENGQEN